MITKAAHFRKVKCYALWGVSVSLQISWLLFLPFIANNCQLSIHDNQTLIMYCTCSEGVFLYIKRTRLRAYLLDLFAGMFCLQSIWVLCEFQTYYCVEAWPTAFLAVCISSCDGMWIRDPSHCAAHRLIYLCLL